MIVLFPQAEFNYWGEEGVDQNVMPCFASGYVLSDEAQYLTNEGVQGKALKGMLERVIEAKN